MTAQLCPVPRRGAAQHIRAALKAAFPSARFTVRRYRVGWGGAYVIRWAGEPSEDEVQALAGALESAKVLIHCEYEDG
jgi:hypothetical protein